MKKKLTDISDSVVEEKNAPELPGAFTKIDGNQISIDMSKLREYNVFIATPCYGGMITDQYFLSIFRTTQVLMKYGIKFRITTLRNESLISRARNILTAMFLESDCTHMLFIDADIEFDPDSVLRALAYDKDILAGAYPKKALPIQYAINFKFLDKDKKKIRIEHGAAEILDASTGFFLVKRRVYLKLIEAHPELHYKNDSNLHVNTSKYCYALYDTMLDSKDNRYLSEDYTFCRRWQKLGGEIWLDLNTKLNHVGSYTFEGDVGKMLSK